MLKKDLLLALQRFPDDMPVQMRGDSNITCEIDRVEMVVQAAPIVVEASNAQSWQQILMTQTRVVLVTGQVVGRKET